MCGGGGGSNTFPKPPAVEKKPELIVDEANSKSRQLQARRSRLARGRDRLVTPGLSIGSAGRRGGSGLA